MTRRETNEELKKKKRTGKNTGPQPPKEVIELIRRKRSGPTGSMKDHHQRERATTTVLSRTFDNSWRLLILQRFHCASITEWDRSGGGIQRIAIGLRCSIFIWYTVSTTKGEKKKRYTNTPTSSIPPHLARIASVCIQMVVSHECKRTYTLWRKLRRK